MPNIQNLQKLATVSLEFSAINAVHNLYKADNLKSVDYDQAIVKIFTSLEDIYKKTLKENNPIVQLMVCDLFLNSLHNFKLVLSQGDGVSTEEAFENFLYPGRYGSISVGQGLDYIKTLEASIDKIKDISPMLEAWHLDKELENLSADNTPVLKI